MNDAIPRAVISRVLEVTAERFGVTPRALVGHGRAPRVARPRQWAMWVAHDATSYSLAQIGRCIGGRHHTTVLHGVRRIAALIAADPEAECEADELLIALSERVLKPIPETRP